MTTIRVLHCRQSDRVWGPERQIVQLAQHLPEYGVEMELVLLRRWGLDAEPHPLAQQVRAAGVQVFEVPARPQDVPQVLHLLRTRLQHCDLLHTHEFKSDLLGILAARRSGQPWMATDHHLATDDKLLLRLFGYVDRLALNRAAAVVVPSHSQSLRLQPQVPAENIHVVYHGIDAAAFALSAHDERPVLRRRYGVSDGQPVVAVFGRLEPVKGHADLLEAAALMLHERPELRFWVVGEGRLREDLGRQAQRLGIENAVQFMGYQREVAPFMAASDLVVLPSRHESFGIVLIEAMSLAKPIVASSAGGIPEIVLDGAHGYLAPPGEPRELAQRALQLLADPAHAAQLGLAGRQRVGQIFTVQLMIERMVALYRQVATSGRTDVYEPGVEAGRLYPLSGA